VPLTLIISPALFVRCGSTHFALPLAVVEEIRRIRADEIEDVGGKLLTKVRDVVTEVVRLDSYLGLPPLEPINGYFRMVVANAGTGKSAWWSKKFSAKTKSSSKTLANICGASSFSLVRRLLLTAA